MSEIDIVRKDCTNGVVFQELDGIKLGDIYQYDPHKFSDYYKQYKVIYLYKSHGANIVQIIYDDGFVDLYMDTNAIKKDKFIKHTDLNIDNKNIDYSDLERIKK